MPGAATVLSLYWPSFTPGSPYSYWIGRTGMAPGRFTGVRPNGGTRHRRPRNASLSVRIRSIMCG